MFIWTFHLKTPIAGVCKAKSALLSDRRGALGHAGCPRGPTRGRCLPDQPFWGEAEGGGVWFRLLTC